MYKRNVTQLVCLNSMKKYASMSGEASVIFEDLHKIPAKPAGAIL